MSFTVYMVRDSAERGGRDRFSCSFGTWELLVEIAKTFGWKPRGTTYLPVRASDSPDTAARHGYQPGDQQDYKRIEAEDAIAWARALSEARRSPHLTAMLAARPGPAVLPDRASDTGAEGAGAPFTVVMDEFIEYAFGGAFSFARAE